MKKIWFIILLIYLNPFQLQAQLTDVGRGIYVDKFLKFSSGTTVDYNNTILGNPVKEAELLTYAKNNHVTYLILYDLQNVFSNYAVYGTKLCDFIHLARNTYCVTLIGAAGGSSTFFNDVNNFNETPPMILSQVFGSEASNYSALSFVEHAYDKSDPMCSAAELAKHFLRIAAFNSSSSVCDPDAKIDVMTTEYEFWTDASDQTAANRYYPFDKYPWFNQNIVTPMDNIRDGYNHAHSPGHTMFTEVYLGYLDDNDQCDYAKAYYPNGSLKCNAPASPSYQNHSGIAHDLDAQYIYTPPGGSPSTVRRLDRMLTHSYSYIPDNVYSGWNYEGYYNSRFVDFCTPFTGTANNTNVHPILSAEWSLFGGEDFLGRWIGDPSIPGGGGSIPFKNRNIFTAEKLFYHSWWIDNSANIHHPTNQNEIQPGGFQWFSSSYMVTHLDPRMLTSNSPICITSGNASVNFTYQGPMEQGNSWDFWVSDDNTPGSQIGLTTNNAWPVFDPVAQTSIVLPTVALPAGYYTAHLKLYYTSTCSYEYDLHKVIVSANNPIIQAATNPSTCSGNAVTLIAPAGASTYTWSNGTTTQSISVLTSGSYSCTMTGLASGCNGTSAPVTVQINALTASVTPQSYSGCNAVLFANPSGMNCSWNDGTTNQTLSVSSSGTYSVSITDPSTGCTASTQYDFEKIHLSAQTTNACNGQSNGSIILHLYDGVPNYQISSPVTINNITVPGTAHEGVNYVINGLSAGTYTVTANDVHGCSRTLSVQVIPDPPVTYTTFSTPATCQNSPDGSASVTNVLGSSGSFTYHWPYNNSTSSSITGVPSGNYIVEIIDAMPCTTAVTISVGFANSAITPLVPTSNSPQCQNVGVNLQFNGSPPAGTTWYWQSSSTGQNQGNSISTYNVNSSGTYYLRAYNNSAGCWSYAVSIDAIVNPLPSPPLVPTSNSPQCADVGVNLIHSALPTGITWYWQSIASGQNQGNSSSTYNVTSTGTYYLNAYDNSTGCWSSAVAVNATVNILPTAPSVPISNSPQCQNIGVTLMFNGSPPAGVTWYWQTSSTGTFTTNSNSFITTNTIGSTTFYLRARNNSTGCWSTVSSGLAINVTTNITPSISILQTSGTNPQCAGASATFTASIINGGVTPNYQWKVDGVNAGTNSSTFTTTTLTDGQILTCVLTSSSQCASPTTASSGGITMTITPFIPLDLYIKDNSLAYGSLLEDDGTEPSPYTQIVSNSPDIWVTPHGVGYSTNHLLNADFDDNPNNVYVTVTNRGCVAYTSGAELHIYWAKASTALDWSNYWTGLQNTSNSGLQIPCLSSVFDLGGEITPQVGGIPITAIPAKTQTLMQSLWTVPNSNGFQTCMPLAYEHFCLVARIVYPTVDPMTFTEGQNIWTNTWENNNIAWRNITVVSTVPGMQSNNTDCVGDKPVGGVVSVGNPFRDPDVYDIEFKVDENFSGLPIFEQAEIKVTLDEKTWDKWAAGGFQSDNFRIKREDCKQLVVTGSPATLKNLAYEANDHSLIALSFNFLTDKIDQTPSFLYHVIEVRNEENREIVGAETYQIGKPSRYLFGADGGGDKTISYMDNVQLSATSIGEPAFYNWYDEDGNMIYSGQNFSVSPEFTKKYKLEVIAQSDGFTSYDSIIVHVKEFEIINLNPNPAINQLTVEYEARRATSAYFSIVQPYTSVSNNYLIDPSLTTATLNLASYAPGSYFIRLICDGQIRDEKNLIIIQ